MSVTKLTSFNKQLGILLGVACILILVSYGILEYYSQKMGLSIYKGWRQTEALSIQQGNLLTAIAKSQRSLIESDILVGISLYEYDHDQPAISYGALAHNSLPKTYISGHYPFIKKNGIFSFTVVDKIESNQNFLIAFDFKPKILSIVFNVLIFSILFLSLFLFVQIRRLEKHESKNRETLLLLAIENLVEKQEMNDVLSEKLPFLVKHWDFVQFRLKKIREFETAAILGKKVSELAFQVSHDIRSPLTVLNLITSTLTDIPEDTRIAMRSATHRINDIANQLLQKGNSKHNIESNYQAVQFTDIKTFEKISGNHTTELLPALIDILVSEKRIQFRTDSSISIETDLAESYGAFAKINSIEFKRVISNLINNAVEAIKRPDGRIVVAVKNYDTKIIVSIRDNGSGIPAHILEQLGQQGVTYGKSGTESGSGLGVYHAKRTIESFDAKFVINSRENLGTEVRMEFLKCETPNWFVPELKLKMNQTIVALDDDSSVLELWKQRFKDLNNPNITLLTYTSELEFTDWVSSNTDLISEILFLMDFELLGQKNTGLQLIEQLKLSTTAILVTSRYEEPSITSKCSQLGVKLLPKGMAGLVPIEFITSA